MSVSAVDKGKILQRADLVDGEHARVAHGAVPVGAAGRVAPELSHHVDADFKPLFQLAVGQQLIGLLLFVLRHDRM